MTTTHQPTHSRAPFFGWAIVGFTLIMQFLTMGTGYYTYGVLLVPLTESLDADRFLVSLGLSLQTLVMALLGPAVGAAVAERSVRVLMLGGAAVLSAGFVLLSQATQLWHLYVAYGAVVATGMAMTGPLPSNALLANWFVKRRGTALGISQFGVTISGTIMVPVTSWIVVTWDWRVATLVFAAAPILIMMPLIWKFAVKHPEDMGLFADGALQSPGGPDTGSGKWSLLRALKDREVRMLTLVVGPTFMAIGSVVLSMHSHATDAGLTVLQASTIVAAVTLAGALAKPLFGILSDRFDKRWVVTVSLTCQIAGVLGIIVVDGFWGLTAAGSLFGLGYGGMMPLWSVLIATLFGHQAFARVMGLMGPLTVPFTLAGLPFTTFVFERTGSYVPAYAIMLTAFFVSLTALWLLRLPEEA